MSLPRGRLDERVERLRRDRRPYVLATVVTAERPTSAKPGDAAVVLDDGVIEGFVGGSCAEASVRSEALRALSTGESVLLRVTPDAEEVARPAATGHVVAVNPCLSGGTLEIFLEPVLPPRLVHVFGDAPIARALAEVGTAAGYDIVLTTDPEAPIAPDAAAVVVASHGRAEEEVLAAALRSGVPYVGLVASRRRGSVVATALGPPRAIVTPAGLDIGATTPGEVALSILAEVVASRPRPPRSAEQPAPDDLVQARDPVCGMTVAAVASSLSVEHDGTTYWFCGKGCLDAFLDEPAQYGG